MSKKRRVSYLLKALSELSLVMVTQTLSLIEASHDEK